MRETLHFWGGPLDGQSEPAEPGWPLPDGYSRVEFEREGEYRRDGDSDRYLWRPIPKEG